QLRFEVVYPDERHRAERIIHLGQEQLTDRRAHDAQSKRSRSASRRAKHPLRRGGQLIHEDRLLGRCWRCIHDWYPGAAQTSSLSSRVRLVRVGSLRSSHPTTTSTTSANAVAMAATV